MNLFSFFKLMMNLIMLSDFDLKKYGDRNYPSRGLHWALFLEVSRRWFEVRVTLSSCVWVVPVDSIVLEFCRTLFCIFWYVQGLLGRLLFFPTL